MHWARGLHCGSKYPFTPLLLLLLTSHSSRAAWGGLISQLATTFSISCTSTLGAYIEGANTHDTITVKDRICLNKALHHLLTHENSCKCVWMSRVCGWHLINPLLLLLLLPLKGMSEGIHMCAVLVLATASTVSPTLVRTGAWAYNEGEGPHLY